MKYFSDLHIHSHYSRATSHMMNVAEIAKYAKMKGLDLVGTGDFTHPIWSKELKEKLVEVSPGVYGHGGMNYILSGEISLIYTQDGKGRKVHNVILAPDFDTADQITGWLKTKGRVDYDGRPIFGFSCIEFVEAMMNINEKIEIIPAHVWTPHFGVLGASSGFNSIEECFQDQSKHIHALETGLSSDPEMNWKVSSLDRYSLVSFSDSHSAWPWRLGREATVFDLKELTYDNVVESIRRKKIAETIEFFPEGGKYHLDGHRNCDVSLEPSESRKNENMCPSCGKPLTIGVLNRVEELSDRKDGSKPEDAVPFRRLFPLSEIIAAARGIDNAFSKKVWADYDKLIEKFGSEFEVLLNAHENDIKKALNEKISSLVIKMRTGDVTVKPGYDGVYGKIIVDKEIPADNGNDQSSLKSFLG